MNGLHLICESTAKDLEPLTEMVEGGGKKYYLQGVFAQAEIKNQNGRVYPLDVLSETVDTYREKFISRNKAFGELDHPDYVEVRMKNVCMVIESLDQQGNDFIGKARILSTPVGNIVISLLEEKVQAAVSTRCLGSVKTKNGAERVERGLVMTAIDYVSDPSAPAAGFIKGILEGRTFGLDSKGSIIDSLHGQYKKYFQERNATNLSDSVEQIMLGKLEEAIKSTAQGYLKE